ncbi:MAG: hypothetical protein EOM20_17090 [Spartobacteria bacterium]|nr:hypothetical protein [Spartobacteria bacterium]
MKGRRIIGRRQTIGFLAVCMTLCALLGGFSMAVPGGGRFLPLLAIPVVCAVAALACRHMMDLYISQRLNVLTAHCALIGGGGDTHLDTRAGDAFDTLVDAINMMSDRLAARRQECLLAEMEAEWERVKLEVRLSEQTREMLCLNDKLQAARAGEIGPRALLHICAECKCIKDENGYFHNIEDFMEEHFPIRFSHGLCPGCMNKLYPFMHGVSLVATLPSMESHPPQSSGAGAAIKNL